MIALQLVMPSGERWGFIHRYHESIFAGRLCVSRTVCRLLDRVYWPGLSEDVISYLASCLVCWRGSLCAPMGLVFVGHCGGVLLGGNIASGGLDALQTAVSVTTEMSESG